MKRLCAEILGRALQFRGDALAHFLCRIIGVSKREDLARSGVTVANQTGDTPGEHGGLARARARDDKHGPVNVLNGFPLLWVEFERRKGGALTACGHSGLGMLLCIIPCPLVSSNSVFVLAVPGTQ